MAATDGNLFYLFHRQFEQRSDDELLADDNGRSWSWHEVDVLSARFAHALTAAGARPNDRVTVLVEKSPEALALYLACLRAGFVYQPLNTAYTRAELAHLVEDAEPTIVVCDQSRQPDFESLAALPASGQLLSLNADGGGSLAALASNAKPDFATVTREPDDLAALLYSSGTTGVPKGIMLTHRNLLSNAQALVETWGFTGNDRLLHALPIYHVHGLFVALHCVLLSGASMRWLSKFDPDAVVDYLPECTVMMGVPTYYTRLLEHTHLNRAGLNRELTQSIRLFISGSAPLRAETFNEFEFRTGHRILERYGMTETGMITSNPLNGERKPGTVGRPLPGVDLRIAARGGDGDDSALAHGEAGAIEVRGANVFAGYWKLPDKTEEDFTGDGFFRTGDVGFIDADSYLVITGREKDLIITGGLNVYPKEVETLIDAVPGVAESAVIGVPHPDFGEAVVAVVASASEECDGAAVLEACKASLAGFKVPKRVCIVAELPRNTMGKVQKNVLRDRYARLMNPES